MLKPLGTCDKKVAERSFRPRRVTKIKLDFLRWIWTKKKCLKSIGNSCVFSILVKSFKKYDFGMRISIGKISAAALLYIIITNQRTFQSNRWAYSPWRNSFVETYPPPRSPAQPLRTLKSFPLFPPTQDVAARRLPARTEGRRMAGTPTIANSNRASGRLKVKVVNRPLDTRRSKS